MKKNRITAGLTAFMFSAACFTPVINDAGIVKATVTEDGINALIENRNEFYKDLKQFDDSGYFEAAFSDYVECVGGDKYQDENFRGKCVPYIAPWYDKHHIILTFPEAKDELTVTFKSCNEDTRTEILKAVTAVTGGTYETYYLYSTGLVLADDVTDEMLEEVKEALKPYTDEGKVTAVNCTGDTVKYKEYTFVFDRLYYNYNPIEYKEDYDFKAVAEFLKEKGEKCHVYVSEGDNGRKMYVVETEEDTPEERCRIAKLILDEFGYEFELRPDRYAPFYNYRTENYIPEYYTTSPPDQTGDSGSPDVQQAAPLTTPTVTGYLAPEKPDYDSIVYGDLNGDGKADVTDITLLSLHLIGDSEITDVSVLEAAYVQNDGAVNLSDLAVLRQFLSKKISFIGRSVGETDITDKCTTVITNGSWYTGDGFMVASMEDYQKYMGDNEYQPGQLKDKGLEITEEFFKDHRLAVAIDKSETCNGVKYTLTAVKESSNGDVHLYYDRFYPSVCTELGALLHHITVIPDNPHNGSRTYVHFNDTHEHNNITKSCRIVNSSDCGFTDFDFTSSASGLITSMKQFDEEITGKGIGSSEVNSRLGISEEFFNDYSLVYYAAEEGHLGPEYRIVLIDFDYEKNLTVNVERYEKSEPYASPSQIEDWFLAAAVPKNVLDPEAVASFKVNIMNSDIVNVINSDMNTKALVSNSLTGFSAEETISELCTSENWFDMINESTHGEFSHLKDEFITEDFFKDNALLVINQPAIKKNFRYNILNLRVNNNGMLEVVVGQFIDSEEPDENSSSAWHLAAAIPKDALVFENISGIRVTYHVQETLLGSYS